MSVLYTLLNFFKYAFADFKISRMFVPAFATKSRNKYIVLLLVSCKPVAGVKRNPPDFALVGFNGYTG